MQRPPDECDVLVVGSGAAGLSAALTASALGLEVVVCDHADAIGGATAISGGELWIPLSRQNSAAGGDSVAEAVDYLRAAVGPSLDLPRAEAYVRNAAAALAFIEDHSAVEYESLPHVVDYFSDAPGAKIGIRTLGAVPFDGRLLGAHFERIRAPLPVGLIFGGMAVGREDFPHLFNVTRSLRSSLHVARMLSRHLRDRIAGHSRGTRMVMGNALVGGLVHALLQRGVPIRLGCQATALSRESGRVTGATVREGATTSHIRCRRAVILASGSFSGSAAMRSRHFPHVALGREHLSPLPPTNDGSGLQLATDCGGAIDESFPEPGAWAPMSPVTLAAGGTSVYPHFGDRAKPGVIVVNRRGRRFVNEATNYHDFIRAMLADCATRDAAEAFVITSHRHLRKYGLGRVPAYPGRFRPFVRSGYLQRGRTVAELADRIGVDRDALQQTIAEFNAHAARGADPVFGKGSTAFERAAGDPSVVPNPCVAPLDDGPWYAIRMVPGDIGTMRGLRVDARSRVLQADGTALPGLYAIGTVASSIMRGTYPAAGAMLGPALTFSYLAALDIAAAPR